MPDSKRYMDWVNKSDADFKSALILFKYEGDYGIVAFHCQQAIEKLLKALLLKVTSELLDGHSLVFLCRKASLHDANMTGFLKDCAYINQFYIETRYPSDTPLDMTKNEAEDCINITEKIIDYIIEKHFSL